MANFVETSVYRSFSFRKSGNFLISLLYADIEKVRS